MCISNTIGGSFVKPHNPYQVLESYFDMFPPEKLFPLHSTTENLEKNTIVIYVSDHGDFNGEYGLIRKGLDLYVTYAVRYVWSGHPKGYWYQELSC